MFFCLSKSAQAFPGVPSCSYFVPSGRLLGAGVERRPPKRGVYVGQRPAELVGVKGFEPCGLFVPAKRCAGWGSPIDEKLKCSDLLRYWRYFVAVQAAREALTNSGKSSDLRKHGRGDRI